MMVCECVCVCVCVCVCACVDPYVRLTVLLFFLRLIVALHFEKGFKGTAVWNSGLWSHGIMCMLVIVIKFSMVLGCREYSCIPGG